MGFVTVQNALPFLRYLVKRPKGTKKSTKSVFIPTELQYGSNALSKYTRGCLMIIALISTIAIYRRISETYTTSI